MLLTAERNLQVRNAPTKLWVILLAALAGLLVIASGCAGGLAGGSDPTLDRTSGEQPATTPLKIGLLLNFTGSPEASADRKRAF